MKKEFNVEYQYQMYLGLIGLDENKMHPEQRKQLREAFYAAFGMALVLLRDDVGALPEDTAIKVLDHLLTQTFDYWHKKGIRNN
jgi:Uncharacterized protein conserved in bacteria